MTDMTAEQRFILKAKSGIAELDRMAALHGKFGGAAVWRMDFTRGDLASLCQALSAPRVPDVVAPHCDYGYITPAKGNSWFAYDPEGDGMLFFETEEEARAVAQKSVSLSLDEFWSEDVDRICYGRVTHAATQVNRSDRPESLDEEGYDEDGEYWPADCEFKCNYELLPLAAATKETSHD